MLDCDWSSDVCSSDLFLDMDLEKISVTPALGDAFDVWRRRREAGDDGYHDVHCWTFTPTSFRLLLSDLFFLGLSPFVVEEVTGTTIMEFYAQLRHVGYKSFSPEEAAAYHAARRKMLRDALREESRVANTEREVALFDYARARARAARWAWPMILARAAGLLARSRSLSLVWHYLAISGSIFFDATFYARAYGVADGVAHYLTEGARLGYDPGPFFSTGRYLAMNPDVAESGVNPLAHYELYGRTEGRKPALR
jgi:hypothetical protein